MLRQPTAGHARWILALILGPSALTGCTTPGDASEGASEWQEPGWMAQVRQQDEEYASAMLSCYAEYGLEGTRAIGGGQVGFLFETDDGSTPEVPPAVQEVIDAASEDCNARVQTPDHWGSALDDASYQRMLELRECVVAHGYEVPEPPSAETWKDSDPAPSAWNPYRATFGGPTRPQISQDEFRSLMEACPQSGPSFFVEVWPDGAP